MTIHAPAPAITRSAVVIYDATQGGCMAALSAAEQGCSVVLISPDTYVGSMGSAGLSYIDRGSFPGVFEGPALRRFIGPIMRGHYGVSNWLDPDSWEYVGPEPHVLQAYLMKLLTEAGVTVIYNGILERTPGATTVVDGEIKTISLEDGRRFAATIFIDASDTGDLLAAAGVKTTYGRESISLHDEPHAGHLPESRNRHNFAGRVIGDDGDGPLPGIARNYQPVPHGVGDGLCMGYGFRVTMTTDRKNWLPIKKEPANYDPWQFELLRRNVQSRPGTAAHELFTLHPYLANAKTDVNGKGPVSTTILDGSHNGYLDADTTERRRLDQAARDYTLGLFYYTRHDPSLPSQIREVNANWGLCRDEFADIPDHLPNRLYLRDGRRIHPDDADFVLTERHITARRPPQSYDSIARGSHAIDLREVLRVAQVFYDGVFGEYYASVLGYCSWPISHAYQIPFRCLRPRRAVCSNLLVVLCGAYSEVAWSSVRMEPQFMMIGWALGLVAAQAVSSRVAVQDVDIAAVQQELTRVGQPF